LTKNNTGIIYCALPPTTSETSGTHPRSDTSEAGGPRRGCERWGRRSEGCITDGKIIGACITDGKKISFGYTRISELGRLGELCMTKTA